MTNFEVTSDKAKDPFEKEIVTIHLKNDISKYMEFNYITTFDRHENKYLC